MRRFSKLSKLRAIRIVKYNGQIDKGKGYHVQRVITRLHVSTNTEVLWGDI